jgi:hypothetical protein
MRDGGKGDTKRPLGVPIDQFYNNWDAIFKKKKVEEFFEESIEQYHELYKDIE